MKSPSRILLAPLALLVVTASNASAQSLQDIYERGQPLPGGQEVSTTAPDPIPFAQVHSNGDIFALIHVETRKDLLIYDGQIVLQEGDAAPLNGLSSAEIEQIHHAYLTEGGNLAWIATLNYSDNTPDGLVVAVDDEVIALEGDLTQVLGFFPSSTWVSFDFVHLSEDGSKLSIQGTIDQNGGVNPVIKARALLTLGNNNSVVAAESIIKVGSSFFEFPSGATTTALREEWFQFQPSENGTQIIGLDYSTPQGSGVWTRPPGVSSQTLVTVQTGPILPGLGGFTDGLVDTGHSINDSGKMAYVLAIDPTNGNPNFDLLVRDSGAYVSPPFPQAALPGYSMVSFAESPMQLSSENDLFWTANYENGSQSARVLFKELDPLVIPGVTQVGQDVVTAIYPWGGAFDISTTGEWVIFSGELDGDYVLLRYRIEAEYDSFCFGDGGTSPGCTSCPCGNDAPNPEQGGCLNSANESALLFSQGRAALTGDSLRFRVERAVPNSFGILVSAQNKLPNQGPCSPGSGVTSPVIDGLRCVGGGLVRHGTRATNSQGEIGIGNNGWGPPHGPMGGLVQQGAFGVGQTRHFQCFYRDLIDQGCMRGQNTTNAITVRVAP